MNANEKAPVSRATDSTIASSTAGACERANRCSATSVSLLVWKIDPCRTSSSRSLAGVDDVAVVADADLAVHAVDEQRLRVGHGALTGRRVARVADRDMAGQRRQRRLGEDLGDVAHLAAARGSARRRQRRCRRSPARDAGARRDRGRPCWPPRSARRYRRRRIPREACRTSRVPVVTAADTPAAASCRARRGLHPPLDRRRPRRFRLRDRHLHRRRAVHVDPDVAAAGASDDPRRHARRPPPRRAPAPLRHPPPRPPPARRSRRTASPPRERRRHASPRRRARPRRQSRRSRTCTPPASRPGRRRSSREPTRTRPSRTSATISTCSARSRARSSAGGSPCTRSSNWARYSEPPSSPRFSPNTTTAAPAVWKTRVTVFDASASSPDDAEHGRRVDGPAFGLVVEADVAAGDRHVERAAGVADAAHGLAELPHDLGPLRVAEVEVVGAANRFGARAGDVARGLGHRQHRAAIRVEIAVAAVAVDRHGERPAACP